MHGDAPTCSEVLSTVDLSSVSSPVCKSENMNIGRCGSAQFSTVHYSRKGRKQLGGVWMIEETVIPKNFVLWVHLVLQHCKFGWKGDQVFSITCMWIWSVPTWNLLRCLPLIIHLKVWVDCSRRWMLVKVTIERIKIVLVETVMVTTEKQVKGSWLFEEVKHNMNRWWVTFHNFVQKLILFMKWTR